MSTLFEIHVKPGIFNDGTYGVFAVPEDNSTVEYQLISRLATKEHALALAQVWLAEWQVNGGSEPKSSEVRDTCVDALASTRTAEKQEEALREDLKEIFTSTGAASFRPFSRITESTPHLLSFLALAVFFFSITISVPDWVPVVGDWLGGKSLEPREFARYYPFLMIAAVIAVHLKVRRNGLKRASARDYVLALALRHGWRREQFTELFIDVMESSGLGWARKLGEWMHKWDPDTLRQINEDANKSPEGRSGLEKSASSLGYASMGEDFMLEDFEARIHAMYYLDKESNYRSWATMVPPVLFLTNHRRAVRRLRALLGDGFAGLLYLSVCSLPGGDDYRFRRRSFPYAAVYEALVFGAPLVWAFILSPWNGIIGWIGMGLVIVGVSLPMLHWNYQLIVHCRGLPRGMSWEEIQGDGRLIKGM